MAERVTLGETFLQLKLDKSVRIIDVACGTGPVAEELKQNGYNNIDGLDPQKGYIEVCKQNNLYQKYYQMGVVPDVQLPIEDETYDVMLCCAGLFRGLMSPMVFPELLRLLEITKLNTKEIVCLLTTLISLMAAAAAEMGINKKGMQKLQKQ